MPRVKVPQLIRLSNKAGKAVEQERLTGARGSILEQRELKERLGGHEGIYGARQTTLASEISITGTGVHSGAPVSIILYPADGDTG